MAELKEFHAEYQNDIGDTTNFPHGPTSGCEIHQIQEKFPGHGLCGIILLKQTIHEHAQKSRMVENVSSVIQELPGLATEKVQQLIALKVVKDQMENEQALAAELVDMSVQFRPDTYKADGQPSHPQPGSNVDVRA